MCENINVNVLEFNCSWWVGPVRTLHAYFFLYSILFKLLLVFFNFYVIFLNYHDILYFKIIIL